MTAPLVEVGRYRIRPDAVDALTDVAGPHGIATVIALRSRDTLTVHDLTAAEVEALLWPTPEEIRCSCGHPWAAHLIAPGDRDGLTCLVTCLGVNPAGPCPCTTPKPDRSS